MKGKREIFIWIDAILEEDGAKLSPGSITSLKLIKEAVKEMDAVIELAIKATL